MYKQTKNQGLETSVGLNNCTNYEVNAKHWSPIPSPIYSKKILIYLGGLPHIIVSTQQTGEYLMEITHIVASCHDLYSSW